MGSLDVVVPAPCRDQAASMAQGVEDVFIQAFIPEASIKTLHKAILHRFPRRNVMPLNLAVLLPLKDRIGGEFSPIVTDQHIGQSSHLCDLIQLSGNPHPGE